MLDLIVLHGEFSLFTVRGNFWYQIYQNQRQKILCQLMALITHYIDYIVCARNVKYVAQRSQAKLIKGWDVRKGIFIFSTFNSIELGL